MVSANSLQPHWFVSCVKIFASFQLNSCHRNLGNGSKTVPACTDSHPQVPSGLHCIIFSVSSTMETHMRQQLCTIVVGFAVSETVRKRRNSTHCSSFVNSTFCCFPSGTRYLLRTVGLTPSVLCNFWKKLEAFCSGKWFSFWIFPDVCFWIDQSFFNKQSNHLRSKDDSNRAILSVYVWSSYKVGIIWYPVKTRVWCDLSIPHSRALTRPCQ